MKKVLILIDAQNFEKSINYVSKKRQEDRVIDWWKINHFVLDYLKQNIQYKDEMLTHLRTYYYTGEITESLKSKIKYDLKRYRNDVVKLKQAQFEEKKAEYIEKGFLKFEENANKYYFFEIRKKPLQYSLEKGIFQKGVDVQIAVDLVANAYQNNYDVLVLFSGDIDLYESIINVKNIGKQVIIFSCEDTMAKNLKKIPDMYIDFHKLDDKILNLFTHIFQKKPKTPIKTK